MPVKSTNVVDVVVILPEDIETLSASGSLTNPNCYSSNQALSVGLVAAVAIVVAVAASAFHCTFIVYEPAANTSVSPFMD